MKPGGDCIIDDPTTSKDSGDISFLKEHTNSHTEPVLGMYIVKMRVLTCLH